MRDRMVKILLARQERQLEESLVGTLDHFFRKSSNYERAITLEVARVVAEELIDSLRDGAKDGQSAPMRFSL